MAVQPDRSGFTSGGARRHSVADGRDELGDQRDQASERRDLAADERDDAGDERDRAADQRDRMADRRDQDGDRRDRAGDQRDEVADRRDQPGGDPPGGMTADGERSALTASASDRREAAVDRTRASEDRLAGARERVQAGFDRSTALADREASVGDRQAASVDGLTQVYLRAAGVAELERDMARARRTGQPLTLVFVDVDHLKSVNDASGHAAGDRMLVKVADALRAHLRPYDLVVRYGGDEFVCALLGLDTTDAKERLALVNVSLAEGGEPGSVTVGVAELAAGDSLEDLVGRADAALYLERHLGRPETQIVVGS
jgi:diguanylate cyclase (GGDEF)-like protein